MTDAQVEIREKAKQARASLTSHERSVASFRICERVAKSEVFRCAQLVACYMPMRTEVDTRPLIERAHAQKKRIFVPVMQEKFSMVFREFLPGSALVKNNIGIDEPVDGQKIPPQELDLVVTPLVAFDAHRHRVGMGGGYYDRAFAFLKHDGSIDKPRLIGVAFDRQQVEKIAPNPWDIPLFRVFTESLAF